MSTQLIYPNLDILPAEKICLHEHHDPQRTQPLRERILESQILYNPPLVIPVSSSDHRFMVLDGANRVTSMKELGLPHILVQIIDPDSPGLRLQTWNHVIWNIAPDVLLHEIQAIDEISLDPLDQPGFGPQTLGILETPDHTRLSLNTSSTGKRSEVITCLVQIYTQHARFDRTMIEEIAHLDGYYRQMAGLIIYPPFQLTEVIQFCREEKLLPAGITRFVVSPRALRINYPLKFLAGVESLEEKRKQLRTFIQERMDKKGVRIYTETTVLYDE